MNKALVTGVIAILVIAVAVVGFLQMTSQHSAVQQAKVNLASAPSSTILLSPVQAQASTGISGYTVGAWMELNNLSGLAPMNTLTSQYLGNFSQMVGTTFAEVLVHNSTSTAITFVSKVNSPNITQDFRKLALILVAGYNFNVNKSGNLEYVYGNISSYGIALGYDGQHLVGVIVTGVNDPSSASLNLFMNQYQDIQNSQSALVQPPSIFGSVNGMKLAYWSYVNYTALDSLNLSNGAGSGFLGKFQTKFGNFNMSNVQSKYQMFKQWKLNVSTGYLAIYANSSSVLAVQVTQFNTPSQAQAQYNESLTFYENLKEYTGMNSVIAQGNLNGAPYFIANPNPINNNTLVLESVSGQYLVMETNYAHVASQSLLLSYLQSLLSQL
ncbi:hypothetical protein HA72_1370 [Metallosphaera sedula]|uniref:Uncharacterized protein n=3 Tax=Metallosphaera TaxID=41980 RepID=A4YGH6_METS5|nr:MULTISPECIES: hypothetical protein [Metallosphaera]ABP95528.1 hypothetical protein Msed_1370 [Metallosphaera sedula DSM 5348]AIM27512.1 hypothetical protein HA72_1370 [Metallosphaera sedula]AKV74379.1 hypothetical protein MsedA_1388 [Metallosphaera sedula]AKV76618.1 hypothetical protein MsedB_1390 [Metallosphaera sedula]AKV78870.1 hypothetical protein MsedC_1388 [Metallosphaera sedula]